jgi:homoserine acetyltransferase
MIRYDQLETGVIIAPDGSEVDRKTGAPDRVGFTGAKLSLVARATLTHNHPAGGSPSVPDMILAAHYSLHELRVVTQEYRFIVNALGGIQVAALVAEYNDQVQRVQAAVRSMLVHGGLRRKDFYAEMVNMAWERAANVLGFYYRRERS